MEQGSESKSTGLHLCKLWAESHTVPWYIRVASEDDRRKIGVVITSYRMERVSDTKDDKIRRQKHTVSVGFLATLLEVVIEVNHLRSTGFVREKGTALESERNVKVSELEQQSRSQRFGTHATVRRVVASIDARHTR